MKPYSDEVDWHSRFKQQAQWTTGIRNYLFNKAGLSQAQRVLEVGCGTGAVLSEMKEIHGDPGGILKIPVGLDISLPFLLLAASNSPGAQLVQGDAFYLPFSSNAFDIVFCHYLLLWLPDPIQALKEMRRVTRPGGWLLAMAEPDYGGRIDYPESLVSFGHMQEDALRQQGASTRLGRQLGSLLHQSGLHEVETGLLGGQWWLADQEDQDWEQEWQVIASDLQKILSPHRLEDFRRLEIQARQSRERLLYIPTFYACGYK